MSSIREFFKPKGKKEIIATLVLFMIVGGFVVFEGVMLVGMFVAPHNTGSWQNIPKMPVKYFRSFDHSVLYDYPTEAVSDYSFFMLDISYLANTNIRMEFDAKNGILDTVVLFSGQYDSGPVYIFFIVEDEMIIELDDKNGFEMDLRYMDYPGDCDVIVIKVLNMAESDIELSKNLVWAEPI